MSLVPIVLVIDQILRTFSRKISKDLESYLIKLYILLIPISFLVIRTLNFEVKAFDFMPSVKNSWLSFFVVALVFIRVIQTKDNRIEVKLLVSALLIFINGFFLNCIIVAGYFLWETIRFKRDGKLLLGALILSLIISTNMLFQFGELITIFLVSLYVSRLILKENEELESSVLYSVAISVLVLNASNLSILKYISLIPYLFLFYKNAKIKLASRSDVLDSSLSMLYLLTPCAAFLGMSEIYYLSLILLLLLSIIVSFKFVNKDNLLWPLAFLLCVFSPPFSLGYVLKIEMLEKAIFNNQILAMGFIPMFIIVQFLFLRDFINKLKKDFDKIKNKDYAYDLSAIFVIVLILLLTLLFIPSNWSETYGNLFNKYFVESPISSYLGLGYYLFWIELSFWLLISLIYFKLNKNVFERILFSIKQPSVVNAHIKEEVLEITESPNQTLCFRTYLSGLIIDNKSYVNVITPFTILMVLVLTLLSVM